MFIEIANLFSPEELKSIVERVNRLEFGDGRATAGWSARLVKFNEQAVAGEELLSLRQLLEEAILRDPIFQVTVRPKELAPLVVARYGPGQTYGSHVDNAIIGNIRTDVSFTLFLNAPDEYEGGELIIETLRGDEAIKLSAGTLFVYPATTLHRVSPVTAGNRVVAVGWARSFIRSAEDRELLFDLDTVRRVLFDRQGKTDETDLLSKVTANLLRRWIED
ncbi:MAG: PKHD-type hydroxylase [Alphaproteobacteria bacterium]|jgi:PKHD-type hydroxylase